MTEKNYGGSDGIGKGKMVINRDSTDLSTIKKDKGNHKQVATNLTQAEISNYKKAGEIAKQAKGLAKKITRKNMLLVDIAERIEAEIIKLGGKFAFPVNLSINEIAAHYTPSLNDETKASGLLKIDIGVHVGGYIADTAFSIDLENSEENKKLIQASEIALEKAIESVKQKKTIGEIGKAIQEAIASRNLSPITNLSGHQLSSYKVHAGLTIPNSNTGSELNLEDGAYAIEPFATIGQGLVYEGKPSGIYNLVKRKATRDLLARKLLDYIEKEFKTLPFSEREIVKKFGEKSKLSLHLMEQQDILHQYPQLIEKSHMPVSQAEDTIIIHDNKVEVTTR